MNQTDPSGLRQSNLKKSFKLAIRSILSTCSHEEFCKVFSAFNHSEQEKLYKLFLQVINSLHGNIEDEFESIFQETQVGSVLDKVEQLVDERNLDILFSEKKTLEDTKEEALRLKKSEIDYLASMLQRVEEQNNMMKTRIESLKKKRQEFSTMLCNTGKLMGRNLPFP